MKVMTYTDFRSQLAGTLDRIADSHCPVLITRQNGKPAVVMSLKDFNAYEETAYLLSSRKNAERLSDAIKQIRQHKTTQRDLIEE